MTDKERDTLLQQVAINLNKLLVSSNSILATTGSIDEEEHKNVVQHAHPNTGVFHFTSGDLTGSQDFILIDISNTIDYPHVNTDYIHLDWLRVHVDADNTADYILNIGFLANVDATNGDFYSIIDLYGDKTVGQIKDSFLNFFPNGHQCKSDFVVLPPVTNDTAFQTDINLATTLSPGSTATPSGNGDLVLRVTRNAGTVKVSIEGSYHTH